MNFLVPSILNYLPEITVLKPKIPNLNKLDLGILVPILITQGAWSEMDLDRAVVEVSG